MKLFRLLLAFALLISNVSQGQNLSDDELKAVSHFINDVKNHRKENIANRISYPLRRQYPLPDIKNKQEFLSRYRELFDSKLTTMISSTSPADWSTVGWRGITIGQGDVWLNSDGIIIAINYESETEKKTRAQLIEKEKKALHPSLRTFAAPVVMLETSKYRIRVDDMGNGDYRYASWPAKRKMSSKPDLVVYEGKFIPDGSGGNHKYQFINGAYTYDCEIIVMGETDTPPAMLIVSQNGKEILSQKAKIVKP